MKPYYRRGRRPNTTMCRASTATTRRTCGTDDPEVQALSQVAKYVTRTYSSKPYAEISDESCLRKGCHETAFSRAW